MRAPTALAAGILMCAAFCPACKRGDAQDDRAITTEIQAKLYRDATLKKRDISIIAQNGVVILSGQVSSQDERAAAERVAAVTGGVHQVVNQLVVVRSSPAAASPKPAATEKSNVESGTPASQAGQPLSQ